MAATSSTTVPTAENISSPIQPTMTNIGSLHNKIAMVTGASSGLGRAIAQAYAAAGAYVVNADLQGDPPPAGRMAKNEKFKSIDLDTPTVDLVNRYFPSNLDGKPRAVFVHCNVTDPASVEAAVEFAVQTYGRLDVMVNNAGINVEAGTTLRMHEHDPSMLDKALSVNVKGVWICCKYAVSQMLKQTPHASGDRGWIINMCSIGGVVGFRNSAAYCTTKGAVLQMTKCMALDYAKDQIHVNCINPGFAQTSMLEQINDDEGKKFQSLARSHPWGRLAMPDDIAKMAVFLAGDGASFVTGAAFLVDGGYCAQ